MGGATITQVTQTPDAGYGRGFDWNLPSLLPNNATTRANGFVNESGLTNAELANAQLPRLGRPELQIGTRDRVGASFAMQYRPNDKIDLTFDALFADLEAEFDRYTNNMLVRNTNAGTNNATGLDSSRRATSSSTRIGTLRAARSKMRSSGPKTARMPTRPSHELHARRQLAGHREDQVGRQDQSRGVQMGLPHDYLPAAVGPGNVSLDINGNGIPTINSSLDLANNANWQFDTVRVQPRTRDETNDTAVLDVHLG
jgi:hypothetical protein